MVVLSSPPETTWILLPFVDCLGLSVQLCFGGGPTVVTEGPDLPVRLKFAIETDALSIRKFENWHDCVPFLKENNIRLPGVEIQKGARFMEGYHSDQVVENTAFGMGNEGQGLSQKS